MSNYILYDIKIKLNFSFEYKNKEKILSINIHGLYLIFSVTKINFIKIQNFI